VQWGKDEGISAQKKGGKRVVELPILWHFQEVKYSTRVKLVKAREWRKPRFSKRTRSSVKRGRGKRKKKETLTRKKG